jgi:threonine dehydrogenase-like Zn-dependent dehydrogenase
MQQNIVTTMPNKKRTLETGPPQNRTKKAKILADELAWKEVAMPDRLDDVEGFFGLEEIDGVDVVADATGKFEFKVWRLLHIGRGGVMLIVTDGGHSKQEGEEDEDRSQAQARQ